MGGAYEDIGAWLFVKGYQKRLLEGMATSRIEAMRKALRMIEQEDNQERSQKRNL